MGAGEAEVLEIVPEINARREHKTMFWRDDSARNVCFYSVPAQLVLRSERRLEPPVDILL